MLVILFMCAAVSAAEPLRVGNAWIPHAPPGARTLAAYFELENTAHDPVELVSAASPDFARVEIHRTEITEGVARMRRVERIAVGPAETVRFQRGGLHLMLIEPAREFAPGDVVELELIREEGTSIRFTAEVRHRE